MQSRAHCFGWICILEFIYERYFFLYCVLMNMAAAFFRISFSVSSAAIRLYMAFTSACVIVSPCRLSVQRSHIRRKAPLRVLHFMEFNNLPFELFCVMFVFLLPCCFPMVKRYYAAVLVSIELYWGSECRLMESYITVMQALNT